MLARWTRNDHDYVVLFHEANRDVCRDLGANVEWRQCPATTAHWAGRAAWEALALGSVAKQLHADFVFTPSGTVVPGLTLPQVCFAQNPWALAEGLERSVSEQAKAALQRRNYRTAVGEAALMAYNSQYMRSLYRQNAGREERASLVVHQGVDDSTFASAARLRSVVTRQPHQILSVSAMAPHKGAETLIEALEIIREYHHVPARLIMAGSWPDKRYRRRIDTLIRRLGLEECVEILGHVSREELNRLYAESRVFSLMSRCESFGIPAVEAQAFGTPVVSSDCCAIPEVCGAGGVYCEPGDSSGVAGKLSRLLLDVGYWEKMSQAALSNAARFHWEHVSRGLLDMFDHV
jgi:glycosyltransferase involved in cell wall biosynthesis